MAKYLLKRLLWMIPLVIAITVTSFIIIQLPPGDFLTTRINQLRSQGENITQDQIDALTAQYGLDQPLPVQFFKWVSGFFRGDFGYSFAHSKPCMDVIWPAFKVSLLIAMIVFVTNTAIGLLLGYVTAIHKNSFIDYFFSFWGYIGSSIPGFMVAMVALWLTYLATGQSFAGLYSRDFLTQAWNWDKALDGAKHLILPVTVITFTTLAGFKSFRANMLDEVNKPYVTTARAKGMAENRLLVKYPVRMALIPSMSTIGLAIPGLISGEAIAGIVLNLPTLGPLMLKALQAQDMYLAGAILFFQSLMTVVGTLVSDIALALIDPRVKFGR